MAAAETGLLRRRRQPRQPHKLFWVALAAPGIIWLTLLFIVPFYVVLAIAAGRLNQLFGTPIAVWDPLQWSGTNFSSAWNDLTGPTAFVGPIIIRTIASCVTSPRVIVPTYLPSRSTVIRSDRSITSSIRCEM